MTVNRLYHQKGIAHVRAHQANTARALPAGDVRRAGNPNRIDVRGSLDATLPAADTFEIFRADEVQVSSIRSCGGDWRWRLKDEIGKTLVEGGGYPARKACLKAVSYLQDRAHLANTSW